MARSRFATRLTDLSPHGRRRRWVFVAYDQLNDRLGPLATTPPDELGIVLVEAPAKARRRPYHRQKLALVLTNLRHFALEQAARGVAVRHVVAVDDYASALAPIARELGPLTAMEPAERELRQDLAPLVARGAVQLVRHDGWLTTADEFRAWTGAPPWRMDAFYRGARQARDILIERGQPVGGRWSHDADNRQPWKGTPAAPSAPRFAPDEITDEVCALIERTMADHPGALDPGALPATAADATALWRHALAACLPSFGPYEDAMSTRSGTLFHTQISGLLNLHRLLPRDVLADALAQPDLPLASREGFVRQVLGWREFVRHVHRETDGFRALPGRAPTPAADPSVLGADRPLPPAFWGARSNLACLDRVVAQVWATGYSHHITRLMVLSNIAQLLDVSPRALTDWFWVAYTDAYDWVVEPNVLGMGTFAAGDVMTTKPYVAGAAYTARMSDYCKGCAFDPRRTCPLTRMYWAYLARHHDALAETGRMVMPLAALRKRSAPDRAADAEVFARVSAALADGRPLDPA
jgi:deoxyribodipyrimidine photolyase-related protein